MKSDGEGERSGQEERERKKTYDETQSKYRNGLLTF